jgi:hypothetical protein
MSEKIMTGDNAREKIALITSKRLKAVFEIYQRESIKNVCGYDLKDLPLDFNYFELTLYKLNNEPKPKYGDKVELLERVIPILIDQLKNENECVIQLYGLMALGELPDIFPYIFTSEANNRYYCPELVQNSVRALHIESWVSFEFNKDQLAEMPLSTAQTVEGFIVDKSIPEIYNTYYRIKWGKKAIEPLLKKSLIYFSTDSDFEYFSVATRIPMETIIKRWQEGLDLYDRGND